MDMKRYDIRQGEAERSVLYQQSPGGLYSALVNIRFIPCGKSHEFHDDEDAASCKLRATNGCCAHQRPFRELGDQNAATIMEDAVLALQDAGLLSQQDGEAARRLLAESRRALEKLDLTAALTSSALAGSGIMAPEHIGLPKGTTTMEDARNYIRQQERAIGSRLAILQQQLMELLRSLLQKHGERVALPIIEIQEAEY